ncbi:hypothetical protein NDU88_004484 [Pleurodeles waltl]|uniref:Uncharacterized protein n=1 Tax=Pleurodeles waltl TaxID=8319 RepID=A0AAV7PFB9_PLEWA|nr:hypothetical protein NDU88_004484 [Pleurodeles waltl]
MEPSRLRLEAGSDLASCSGNEPAPLLKETDFNPTFEAGVVELPLPCGENLGMPFCSCKVAAECLGDVCNLSAIMGDLLHMCVFIGKFKCSGADAALPCNGDILDLAFLSGEYPALVFCNISLDFSLCSGDKLDCRRLMKFPDFSLYSGDNANLLLGEEGIFLVTNEVPLRAFNGEDLDVSFLSADPDRLRRRGNLVFPFSSGDESELLPPDEVSGFFFFGGVLAFSFRDGETLCWFRLGGDLDFSSGSGEESELLCLGVLDSLLGSKDELDLLRLGVLDFSLHSGEDAEWLFLEGDFNITPSSGEDPESLHLDLPQRFGDLDLDLLLDLPQRFGERDLDLPHRWRDPERPHLCGDLDLRQPHLWGDLDLPHLCGVLDLPHLCGDLDFLHLCGVFDLDLRFWGVFDRPRLGEDLDLAPFGEVLDLPRFGVLDLDFPFLGVFERARFGELLDLSRLEDILEVFLGGVFARSFSEGDLDLASLWEVLEFPSFVVETNGREGDLLLPGEAALDFIFVLSDEWLRSLEDSSLSEEEFSLLGDATLSLFAGETVLLTEFSSGDVLLAADLFPGEDFEVGKVLAAFCNFS